MCNNEVVFVSLELHGEEIIEIAMTMIADDSLFEKKYVEYFVKPKNLDDFIDRGRITVQELQTAKEFKDIQGDIFVKLNGQFGSLSILIFTMIFS